MINSKSTMASFTTTRTPREQLRSVRPCRKQHSGMYGTTRCALMKSSNTSSPFTKSDEVEAKIQNMLGKCMSRTDLQIGVKKEGKVRDIYELSDKLIIITTDRQSAFDRNLTAVPFKGQVVNQTSAWWLEQTKDILENAMICAPHPNITVMKKCRVFPVEFVVRGYLTGTTGTSIWEHYRKGSRDYCGNKLPDGMEKNDRLHVNMITPTTKAEIGDEPINPDDIVKRGLMTKEQWEEASSKALKLFAFGQKVALEHGLLLVDTKYEFGVDEEGNVLLIDEIHTPDSSRYWIAETYEKNIQNKMEPDNIDKEFLRLWYKQNCDPYNDKELPKAPESLVTELSRRYITLYETITGKTFNPASPDQYYSHYILDSIDKVI